METKILKAVFGGGRYAVTTKRTRTDYGQVLEFVGVDLPDTFECIFSNSATSAGVGKKMIGSSQRVLIPDEYLKTGQTIYAWVLLHDSEDDGRHMYNVKIPVDDMPDTSPEEPTPVEQSVISQAIMALNTAVDTTSQKAQEATESADRAEQAAEGVEAYVERAESAQQAAESARDRATQAETSARTSAATASEKASEAISSAATASQSALTAEGASESAQASADASYQNAQTAYRYAQDSATSAGQAESYASDAGSYASDAQTHSQTASQKASEAAQSTSTAVQAKTDAETAKTASETAQGLAESARDNAITAKTDAESARDEAQEIVDGITNKIEQIDSNTDRIESLEDDRYKPYAVDTASGAVASFPDGADGIPLKSCMVQVEPVQEGSGDPSPENVRPISGWTGVEVRRTGKNLFPHQNIAVYTWDFSQKYALSDAVNPVFLKANTTYMMTIDSGNKLYRMRFWDASGTLIQGYVNAPTIISGGNTTLNYYDVYEFYAYNNLNKATNVCTITPVIDTWMDMVLQSNVSSKNQLELGSTATDYEPYQGETYPITFPSEAGTVYGAYVDVINGELVVDRAMVTLDEDDIIGINVEGQNCRVVVKSGKISIFDVYRDGVCNKAVVKTSGAGVGNDTSAIGINNPKSNQFVVNNAFGTTLQEIKNFVGTDGLQICTYLDTPIHYPLTSNQINSLYGKNNLWADTGDTEVEYRADTTLYIKRLTDSDTDMIADANIVSGQYFMVGNNLYRATANIASGASVIEGTNATKVSLATALNEINA